ncbi:hypothetical protein F511_34355 [Dorcoceras hygrometricum]|uniref:Uncharacterized protein n=1 Tax=Dorcoceras hygrometricum TaxID=472368 RepID=A0A2Z7BMU8_9LAMI|nr:hypothetical protein F511_34355 [Dorcoceras hygrometricum]
MSSKSDLQPEISLLSGDDGFCIRTFLARETSVNYESYDLFYREPEGIPFRWEAQPGTPRKYPQQDGLTSTTTPLSPSPLMQSLKLHPPDHEGSTMLKSSKVESFKKLVRRSIAFNRDKVQKKEPLRFGESVKDSSMFDSGSCFINGNVAGVALQVRAFELNFSRNVN